MGIITVCTSRLFWGEGVKTWCKKQKQKNTWCNSCQGSVTRKHLMLPILKYPMGCAVILLVPGAQRICGAATPREWEWTPCPVICQSSNCWHCFPLPVVCLPVQREAGPGQGISPFSQASIICFCSWSVEPWGILETTSLVSRQPKCWQAGLPGKFKMHLCVEISVVSLLFTPLCLIVLTARSMFGEKFIYNQGRDPGEPFFEYILQMVGSWEREVLCPGQRPAQLKFSDSLLRGTTQAPRLPLSQKGRSSKPSQSLVPGPVGVPGSLTPWFGSPQSMWTLPFVFHLVVQQAVCVSAAPTSVISLVSWLRLFLSSAWAGWNLLLSVLVSSCSFVSSLPLDCQYFLVLCPVVLILRSLVDRFLS